MGSGASIDIPDTLTEHQCREIAGKSFDDGLFQSIASGGVITKDKFAKLLSLRTDCFLTHDWGKELGQDNHARVGKMNRALQNRGLTTWFDEEQMQGNIKKQMVSGIDNAQCVVVFITKRYTEKVAGDNAEDNCQLEFNYAALRKTATRMISVVMEERMRNTRTWGGEVAMVLGGRLYIDLCGNLDDEKYLNEKADELYEAIMGVISVSVKQFNLNLNISKPKQMSTESHQSTVVSSTAAMPDTNTKVAYAGPVKSLIELSIDDVCSLLDSLNFGTYSDAFKANSIDGACLKECSSADELKEMGISMTVKAKLLYTKLVEFQSDGVPEEYLPAYKKAKAKKEAEEKAKKAKAEAEEKAKKDKEAANNDPKKKEQLARTASRKPICTKFHDMPYILTNAPESAYQSWACGLCEKECAKLPDTIWSLGRYHCKQDQDDICVSCYDKGKMNSIPKCKNGHDMPYTLNSPNTPGVYRVGWNCDHCSETKRRSKYQQNGRYCCVPCTSDYCTNCVTQQPSQNPVPTNVVFTRMHKHNLEKYESSDSWYCNGKDFSWGCESGFTSTVPKGKGHKRFRCNQCDFDLCEKCVVANMIVL